MSDYIPVEVILKILERLPAKSLVRFRSVCKTWNTLISHPSFISTHLQASLSNNNTPFLLLYYRKNGKYDYFLHYDNDGFEEFKQLQFPFSDACVSNLEVIGSCNGLICLDLFSFDVFDFVLWNPSIQKYTFLPQPRIPIDADLSIGFGFDSRTNDYKLLILVDDGRIKPYLFSFNENCWKSVTADAVSPDYIFVPVVRMPLNFVNGAFHLLVFQIINNEECNNAILVFNLSAEELFVINLPESLIGVNRLDLSIMKYGESSIAVVWEDTENFDLLELWVMKEYGVVESWTKLLTLHRVDRHVSIPRVLGFRKNGEVLLRDDDKGKIASLDLNCQQMEASLDLIYQQMKPCGVDVEYLYFEGSYVESLVLLDKEEVHVNNVADSSGGESSVNPSRDSSDSDELCGVEINVKLPLDSSGSDESSSSDESSGSDESSDVA